MKYTTLVKEIGNRIDGFTRVSLISALRFYIQYKERLTLLAQQVTEKTSTVPKDALITYIACGKILSTCKYFDIVEYNESVTYLLTSFKHALDVDEVKKTGIEILQAKSTAIASEIGNMDDVDMRITQIACLVFYTEQQERFRLVMHQTNRQKDLIMVKIQAALTMYVACGDSLSRCKMFDVASYDKSKSDFFYAFRNQVPDVEEVQNNSVSVFKDLLK